MLFNADVLFIHVPKTGGMSIGQHLLRVLPRPVYYAYSGPIPVDGPTDGVVRLPGIGHESLDEAATALRARGLEILGFRLILAALRNPYELEVSRYAYLRLGHPWDRSPNQGLAMRHDFETFAIESSHHAGPGRPPESYFLLHGEMPPNLRIARFETLAPDVTRALREVGLAGGPDLPRVNRSRHRPFLSYYTRDAEEAVYRKYRWVFDRGFYERLTPDRLESSTRRSPSRERLERVRAAVAAIVPPAATVAVLWQSEKALPEWEGRRVFGLADMRDAAFGDAEAESARAIAQLDALRTRGAGFVLVPSPAFQWLEYVPGFQQHLSRLPRIWDDEDCRIYRLGEPGGGDREPDRADRGVTGRRGSRLLPGWRRILAGARRVRDRVGLW